MNDITPMAVAPLVSSRGIAVLGSTGSIGTNTLQVVEHLIKQGQPFEVIGLAAASSWKKLAEQAVRRKISKHPRAVKYRFSQPTAN